MREDFVNVVVSFQKLTQTSFQDILELPYPFYLDVLESRIKLEEDQRKKLGIDTNVQQFTNDILL